MFSSSSGRYSFALSLFICAVSSACAAAGQAGSGALPAGFVSAAWPQAPSLRKGFTLENKCARPRQASSALRMNGIEEFIGDYKVGDAVKLAKDIVVYHVNPKEPDGITLKAGLEGVVLRIVTDKHPKATPNWPLVVQFQDPKKFFMHLEANDLEKA